MIWRVFDKTEHVWDDAPDVSEYRSNWRQANEFWWLWPDGSTATPGKCSWSQKHHWFLFVRIVTGNIYLHQCGMRRLWFNLCLFIGLLVSLFVSRLYKRNLTDLNKIFINDVSCDLDLKIKLKNSQKKHYFHSLVESRQRGLQKNNSLGSSYFGNFGCVNWGSRLMYISDDDHIFESKF